MTDVLLPTADFGLAAQTPTACEMPIAGCTILQLDYV